MTIASTIRAMRAAGIDDTKIIETVLSLEEERLAKGRARTAKSRRKNKKRDVTGVTHVTKKEKNQKKKTIPPDNSPSGNISTPRAELRGVLDAERADAVIEHRQRLRRPLTLRAARLLASEFAKATDPNAAADEMLTNGWQGFKAAWLETKAPPVRHDGSGVYIRKGSKQWQAWEHHGRKVNDWKMLDSMKAVPEGGERKFLAEWPSKAF